VKILGCFLQRPRLHSCRSGASLPHRVAAIVERALIQSLNGFALKVQDYKVVVRAEHLAQVKVAVYSCPPSGLDSERRTEAFNH
jgi:hypothetical protein